MSVPENTRVAAARADLDKATRTTRLAAIAARDALLRRAARRRRLLSLGTLAAAVVAVALIVALIVLPLRVTTAHDARDRDAQVLAAATQAVITMLTADPKHADTYADSVIALSIGGQRDTLTAGRAELIAEIARQPQPSTGVVLSVGLITDPADTPDATADVLLVAEATNPALIGGDPSAKRMSIVVTMTLDAGAWKVSKAGLQS